ncbi:hypothetical protein Q427_02590 [Halomonas sp. BC04]|nr:hypothetical protein Q427_02590 [Halomonas sp. BC04]
MGLKGSALLPEVEYEEVRSLICMWLTTLGHILKIDLAFGYRHGER